MNVVEVMDIIAAKWHSGQVRKYTGEPYITHPRAVRALYAEYFPNDLVGQAVALGHDLFEDTKATISSITLEARLLGYNDEDELRQVFSGIVELTDVYTSQRFPGMPRRIRKDNEAIRLEIVSHRSKNVKLCDLIDNTTSILEHDTGFARTYLSEKIRLISRLTQADQRIFARIMRQTADNVQKLVDLGLSLK